MKGRHTVVPWVLLFFFILLFPVSVRGEKQEDNSLSEIQEELLDKISLTDVQKMVDELLDDQSFSLGEAVRGLMSGEKLFSREALKDFFRSLFFRRLEKDRLLFAKILVLILMAAIFSNFAEVYDSGQIGEICFYMVYLLLFTLLMGAFSDISRNLSERLDWIAMFMKGLAPAYLMAVTASSGPSMAAVFYEGILFLVWVIQWILVNAILPGINLYVLIRLVNHLSREEMLGKMGELLNTMICWSLKTLLGAAVGLQVVQNLVAPVLDSLKRSALGKTAGALPGIGNAVNMVTELILASAVLVRNCMGAAFLAVLVFAAAEPVIHYGGMSLACRFLAAVSQPVSDKRMVECLSTMGEGCALLLKVLFTAEVMCMLALVILMTGMGG